MTEKTADEIVAKLKEENRKAVDAAYRQGIADATPPDVFEYNTGMTRRIHDPGVDDYEAELQAMATSLRMKGIVGNLSNHPDMAAIRVRHGR